MFGPRLQDQTFISGELAVLHVLHRPFTWGSHLHLHHYANESFDG